MKPLDQPFRIVTHRNWLAQHFAEFGAVQDFGFDIDPDTAEETVWWAPTAWVACAWASGIRLPLTLCGHRWMADLPYEYKQRNILVTKIQRVLNNFDADPDTLLHVKLTEAKLDSFPATLHSARYLADALKQYHIPKDSLVQISEPVSFVKECRFWIADRQVTASSWYLINGRTPDCDDFEVTDDEAVIQASMRVILEDDILLDPRVDCPPGFVIDMGLTDDGRILVVETNASWSSSPYNGDAEGIVRSIVASHDFDNEHPYWHWRPNPVYGLVQPLKWAKPVKP